MTNQQLSTNTFGCAKWIVSSDATQGTHTTIAAALTSASSGDTIFIRPGTYTENITLKAGVDLSAYSCDSINNVIIKGTTTASYNGTVSCSGIQFLTNGAAAIDVSSANTSSLVLRHCSINGTDGNGIDANAANFSVFLYQCSASTASTNKLFNVTTIAGISSYGSLLTSTSTASTIAAGSLNFFGGECASIVFTTSSTGAINAYNLNFNSSSLNTSIITTAGTGNSNFHNCQFFSGTASSISIGSGTTVTMANCTITSSNTNAITGAGTLIYTNLAFLGTSSTINTTTKTPKYTQLSQYKATEQPAFLAYNSATDTNVSGDGTNYTVICDSEVFDQNSNYNNGTGVFTAPVTGRYNLTGKVFINGGTSMTSAQLFITTSNRIYKTTNSASPLTASTTQADRLLTALADMDVADTATINIATSDGGGKVDDVYGEATDLWTYFCGNLQC